MDDIGPEWIMQFHGELVDFGAPAINGNNGREIEHTPGSLVREATHLHDEARRGEERFAALKTPEGLAAARLFWEIREVLSAHTVHLAFMNPTVEDITARFHDDTEDFYPRLRTLAAMFVYPSSLLDNVRNESAP